MAQSDNLCFRTESDLRSLIASGETTRNHAVESQLDRISLREPQVQAWTWHDPDSVRRQLQDLASMPAGPLSGVTIAVKDLIDTADMPTEYGSAAYRGHQPVADAGVVTILKAAGALMMGKTVTTEFAHSHAGPTVNPHNLSHTPGGSSSGSAAAVADGMATIALGTQTGGSVIRPAAYCGVVGFKPTIGRITLAGVMPLSFSMDTLGVMARSVADVQLISDVLLGYPESWGANDAKETKVRLAYYPGPDVEGADQDAVAALDIARSALAEQGVEFVPIMLPLDDFAELGRANRTLMAYEAARQHRNVFRMHSQALGETTRTLIEEGAGMARSKYLEALRHQVYCRQMFADQMQNIDAVLTLSAPGQAPLYKDGTGSSIFNRTWTTIGAPCLTLPAGHGSKGLPLGVQLVGKMGQDHALLALGRRFEDLFRQTMIGV